MAGSGHERSSSAGSAAAAAALQHMLPGACMQKVSLPPHPCAPHVLHPAVGCIVDGDGVGANRREVLGVRGCRSGGKRGSCKQESDET